MLCALIKATAGDVRGLHAVGLSTQPVALSRVRLGPQGWEWEWEYSLVGGGAIFSC